LTSGQVEVAQAETTGPVAQKQKRVAIGSDKRTEIIGSAVDFWTQALRRPPWVVDCGATGDINVLTTRAAGTIGNIIKTQTSLCDERSDVVRAGVDGGAEIRRWGPIGECLCKEREAERRKRQCCEFHDCFLSHSSQCKFRAWRSRQRGEGSSHTLRFATGTRANASIVPGFICDRWQRRSRSQIVPPRARECRRAAAHSSSQWKSLHQIGSDPSGVCASRTVGRALGRVHARSSTTASTVPHDWCALIRSSTFRGEDARRADKGFFKDSGWGSG